MEEKDFFNRDSMYWREVNATSAGMHAELELNEQHEVEGEWLFKISGTLLPFDAAEVIYEMEDGGAFKKNEVSAWPYVLSKDLDFYQDESKTEEERKAKVHHIAHSKIQSITLKDEDGNVILSKAKI